MRGSPQPLLVNAEIADEGGCYVVAGLSSSRLQRLNALQAHDLLDAAAQHALNELTHLAAMCCEVPIAVISLLDRDSRLIQGGPGAEVTCRDHRLPFCAHVIAQPSRVMVIPDARCDARFACNPLVTLPPGMVFFAVAPLIASNGKAVGALCIADHKARDMSEAQHQMLQGLAAQAAEQVELRGNIMLLEAKVASQSHYMDQLKNEHLELQKQNATDPLTGLGNRRSFHDRLALEIGRAECTGTRASLIMFDVDHFKSYNDNFGHPAGDAVLKKLADVILESCREEDFAARVGGEEFAVLLPGTNAEKALAFAKWLGRRVQRQAWAHRPVTISAGVAVAAHGESGLQLTARADVALYRSKRNGRNRATPF
ncbi:MAG: sensor domain-containing diguanylate cyclase [Pseudomonadota bacterium]